MNECDLSAFLFMFILVELVSNVFVEAHISACCSGLALEYISLF